MPFDIAPFYKTPLGRQIVGDSRDVLEQVPDESIDLVVTSPPYALLYEKSYCNEDQADYITWLSDFGREIRRTLKPTGSLVLNLGGSYQKGRPTRSLWQFRTLIEFCDTIGYHLAEEFFWYNSSKMPSPAEWVNVRRIRVKDAVEVIWWLSKGEYPKADNRKVLTPYGVDMKGYIRDGTRPGVGTKPSGHEVTSKFVRDNGGAIPPNLIQAANADSNSHYLRTCRALGLDIHPARFPAALPEFFIKFLTEPGDIVVDPFSGSNTTGRVAEDLGRRWLSIELDRNYAAASVLRFLGDADVGQKKAIVDSLMGAA